MDINPIKLARVVSHLRDDGACNPTAIAAILKSPVANVAFARAFVEEAARTLNNPALLEEFDTPETETVEETPKPVAKAPAKAPAPAPKAAAAKAPAKVAAEDGDTQYFFATPDGLLLDLIISAVAGKRVILRQKAVTSDVEVILCGQKVTLDLLNIPESMEVEGRTFDRATLQILAESALQS